MCRVFFIGNKTTEYAVKVKIVRENGKHCVKEVWGDGWRTIVDCDIREDALIAIEAELNNKAAQWSREIKMRASWVCCDCGEGLYDKELLEAHHIKPRAQFPALMYDLDNGKCVCLWGHALVHQDNPVVMNMILLRLVRILTRRHCQPFSKCQMKLLGLNNEQAIEETGGEETHK